VNAARSQFSAHYPDFEFNKFIKVDTLNDKDYFDQLQVALRKCKAYVIGEGNMPDDESRGIPVWTRVLIAAVPVLGVIVVGYWQFVYRPTHTRTSDKITYSGRVTDSSTQQVIRGAKVSIEEQGPPQIYYTDSDGYFYLKLSGTFESIHIRVEANNYESFDRAGSVSRTGVEDVRLVPKVSQPSTPPTPLLTPTTTPSAPLPLATKNKNSPQPQVATPAPITFRIAGMVVDENGQPLQGAKASLDDFPERPSVETASNGSFVLENIPRELNDQVRIRISLAGYHTKTKDVIIGRSSPRIILEKIK
jgi:hypothetical protein